MIYNKNPFASLKKFKSQFYIICDNEVFFLDGAGIFIWNNLDGNKSAEDIAKVIVEEYDIDLNRANKDVEKFLKNLLKYDIIS